jgi:ABC-type sulfate transport system permease subunit
MGAFDRICGLLTWASTGPWKAAQDLGANAWVTFRKITLPLIMPGVLAGALMAFALSIDDFVTSNFVSGASVPSRSGSTGPPGSASRRRCSCSAAPSSQSESCAR